MASVIDAFEPSWRHTRQLTLDFIAAEPAERWDWTPHPRYATLAKQFRHVLCVHGVYIDGLEHGRADFARKHSHYDGPLERDSLLQAFAWVDERQTRVLQAIRRQGEDDFSIEFYGNQKLGSYLNAFLHHEALHHGQWSFYATLGGFETPLSWQVNWGL
jgi:uncharacterized damage-inducible protein DinB